MSSISCSEDIDHIESYLKHTVAGDTTQVFSISCRFLNYINQLTVIICYQSVSILSFIDWSSLDIAKHVASNTFHEHFGSSMEKNICKTVFSGSLKLLFKLMSTSSKYLIREFWDKYVIIIMDDFLVLPARIHPSFLILDHLSPWRIVSGKPLPVHLIEFVKNHFLRKFYRHIKFIGTKSPSN